MEKVNFSGQLDFRTYYRAISANSPKVLKLIGWMMIIAPILTILLNPNGEPISNLQEALPIVLILPVLGVFMLNTVRIAAKRAWKNTRVISESVSGTISEEGIESKSETVQSQYSWAKLFAYTHKPDFLMIFISPNACHILPKSYFQTEEDWTNALQLVKANLKKK